MEGGFNVVGFRNPDGEILLYCGCVCVDEVQSALSTRAGIKIMDANIRRSRKATLPQVRVAHFSDLFGHPHTNKHKSNPNRTLMI